MRTPLDALRHDPDNASMEARIARIETHVEHLNANVVDLRATTARLATKIDDLGSRLDTKIDDLGRRFDDRCRGLDARFDDLARHVDSRFFGRDGKIDRHFPILGA